MRKYKVEREGNIIQGHVLDVARSPLQEALQSYDEQLYIRWNPKKRSGRGIWEIRRRPDEKTAVYACTHQGIDYYDVKYKEKDIINHVLDLEYLNYNVLSHIKKMDVWNLGYKGKNLVSELDYREAKFLDAEEDKAWKEREYNIKQHKTLIRDFMDYTLSGGNPYRIADHWNN